MLDDLEPVVRHTIMSILAVLYESGMVDTVSMKDVLRLFGAQPLEEVEDAVFSFDDPGWQAAYIDFRESENALMEQLSEAIFDESFVDEFGLEDEIEEDYNQAMNPDRKLH